MRCTLVLAAFWTLSACGADGPPERPSEPGITITGRVEVGVTGGS